MGQFHARVTQDVPRGDFIDALNSRKTTWLAGNVDLQGGRAYFDLLIEGLVAAGFTSHPKIAEPNWLDGLRRWRDSWRLSPLDHVWKVSAKDAEKEVHPSDEPTYPVIDPYSWPKIARPISDSPLLPRVAKAIEYIEKGGYGKVDTYPTGCMMDTFHFHLLVDMAFYRALLEISSEMDLIKARELLGMKFVYEWSDAATFLYHTSEVTGCVVPGSLDLGFKFSPGSPARNMADHGNGVMTHYQKTPGDDGVGALPGFENLGQFLFAVIPPGEAFYARGYPIFDGRRIIVWPDNFLQGP